MLALGRTGTTGTWTGLAAGELVSAGFALLVLRRLDVADHARRDGGVGDDRGRRVA